MRKYFIAASVSMLLAQQALAEAVPSSGPKDNRVRYVDYHPSEVYRINAQYGIATNIVFSSEVTNVAVGDPNAWDVSRVNNRIFIRPIDDDPATNMTVITSDGKSYNLWLSSDIERTDNNINNTMFQISFRYPEEEYAQRREEQNEEQIQNALEAAGSVAENWQYFAKGSRSISPASVYDDGRFTYLTFTRAQDMPAVYIENEDGESLVNTHVDGNKIVIEQIAEKIILRYGNQVACIFNQGPPPSTDALPDSRTVSPIVERRVRSTQ